MATYNTLKRGSTGADVKKLQQSLMDKGYDLGKTGADGKYGAITEAAVKKYQKDNKLTIDGMAGNQTQGALYTVPKATTTTKKTTTTPKATTTPKVTTPKATVAPSLTATAKNVASAAQNAVSGAATKAVEQKTEQMHETDPLPAPVQNVPTYDPAVDAAYQSALSTLMQVQQTVPTYKDSFSSQLQDVYNKIVNRDKFSYDVNSDAMYQQYKDQYIAQGKLAMADTMGQAAAMNGGYGSSYAQSVGQQAYQGYMQQLNDVVPELYDRALAQYNQEGQDMLNQYAMLGDMADDEYAKYQNELNDYYTRLSMAREDVDKAYNRGYQASRDAVGDKQWQDSFDYGKERDEVSDKQWQDSFDYGKERDEVADDQWLKQYEESIKQNAISNKQWEDSFGYQKEQDKIANNQWQQSFDHNVEQDKIANDRYEAEANRANKNDAYNRVMSFIGSGYNPSDSELSAAGLTRAQYDAISKYATTSTGTTKLDNVASMSSTEIVEAMQGYNELGDNKGLESFLDDCVATGRMTEAQADEYYRKYGTDLDEGRTWRDRSYKTPGNMVSLK